MEKQYISQAVAFLNSLSPQDAQASTLAKLIRKNFPEWPIPLVGLVTEQSELRKKAVKKFKHSQQMIFTRKGLEQSTSEELAIFTASLFKNSDQITDVCSGIGGNTIGMQYKFKKITTVEPDPLLNAIHEHNLNLYNPSLKIERQITELHAQDIQESPCVFIDPDRRATGNRSYSIEDHSPDIKFILDLNLTTKEIMIKLSPMLYADQTYAGFSSLFLADEMELKQNLWLGGSLKNTNKNFAIHYKGTIYDSSNLPEISTLDSGIECIYEMNPAIIKSETSFSIAKKYKLLPISGSAKHFVGKQQDLFPFASTWKILIQEPFHLKKITSLLQTLPFERFEIKPYGIEELETKKLISKWGKGLGKAGTVFIFKQKDFKQIIVGEKIEPSR